MRIPFTEEKLILSIYDYSTDWVRPYIDAGYPVIVWDKKVEGCILEGFTKLQIMIEESGLDVYGIMFAPPCTDFSVSGAWTWPGKDKPSAGYEPFDNTTDLSVGLAAICLHMVDLYKPKFWVLENPIGRLEKLIPEFQPYRSMMFQPWQYGDAYTKKTVLWGEFNTDLPQNIVEPIKVCAQGSWLQKLGGKSEKTKTARSMTPKGFANSFYQANK